MKIIKSNNPINHEIREKEVRLISSEGEQLGIVSSRDALKMAEDQNLDLVMIAPTAKPPVCKIMDYHKFTYEQAKKEKEAKKKQRTVEIKEVRLSPNIDTNDLNTKMNNAKKFISKGNKVKVTLRFRGREMAHVQQSKHILDDFAKQQLIEGLSEFYPHDFEINEVNFGFRPTVRDRRPILGSHPEHPNFYVFNGLGARGILNGCFFSKELYEHIENQKPLMPEVDLKRFTK